MADNRVDIDEMIKPQAESTQWYKCDSCDHLHVRLMDEHGELIATAVVGQDMLEAMLRTIKDEDSCPHPNHH